MKSILKAGTAMALILSMAGQTFAAEMLTSVGAGEGSVVIVAWPGYIERGDTDPDTGLPDASSRLQ